MVSDRLRQRSQQLGEAGRLRARPSPPTEAGLIGMQPLGLGGDRDGLLYVPASYQPDRPAPLGLMLHGAGGDAYGGLFPFVELADAVGGVGFSPS